MMNLEEYSQFLEELKNKGSLSYTVSGRPVPAVRTTTMQKFSDPYYKKYKIWKDHASACAIAASLSRYGKIIAVGTEVLILARFYIYKNKKGKCGDVDNYIKSVMDSLGLSKIINNDILVKTLQEVKVIRTDTEEEERSEVEIYWEL